MWRGVGGEELWGAILKNCVILHCRVRAGVDIDGMSAGMAQMSLVGVSVSVDPVCEFLFSFSWEVGVGIRVAWEGGGDAAAATNDGGADQ